MSLKLQPPVATRFLFRDFWKGLSAISFEKQLAKFLDVEPQHLFLTNCGGQAFFIILKTLKEISPEQNEVVLPNFGCLRLLSAVQKAGLLPRTISLEPATLNFKKQKLVACLSEKTLAVVAVHYFGYPIDIPALRNIIGSQRNKIWLIEDCAQALGASFGGQKVGTLGDVSFFSFGRGKNYSLGGGGAILTRSRILLPRFKKETEDLRQDLFFELCLLLKFIAYLCAIRPFGFSMVSHLCAPKDEPKITTLGMGKIRKALGRNFLSVIEREQKKRQEHGLLYEELFKNSKVSLVSWNPSVQSPVFLRFPVFLPQETAREKVIEALQKKDIKGAVLYPAPLECYVKTEFHTKLILLPTHSFMAEKDIQKTAETVLKSL